MIKRQRDRERKRERESNNITSVFISVWINIVGYCKTNNQATFKQVILQFASFALKTECYQCIDLLVFLRRIIAKEKWKQIKNSGKYQNLKKFIS